MTSEIININDKKVINLLNKRGELHFIDFERIYMLSVAGTKSKILDWISKCWIKKLDNKSVVYSYVAGDNLPEVEE